MSYFMSLNPLSLFRAMPGSIAQGMIWGVMALGVYITFRLLDFADLTVDGSIATGAAVSVMLIRAGVSPIATLPIAFLAGALAGMVESVYLNDGHTGPEAATVMFDCTLRDYGPEATVKSFGIPDYPGDHYGDGTRTTERSYHLNLEVRLHNGAMKTFEFDVTDQVKAQPRGGVIIVSDGLVITDEEGAAGSDSGFDIDVEGWGDYIDIPLPL